ncbi:MAG: formate dehydrogenase accessory sulfurtransferase FdhD [Steroidobacteraceae bacterium]
MREASRLVVHCGAGDLQTVAGAPRLTAASCDMLREIEIMDEYGERRGMDVPAERPLTIFLDGRELVTLMTLGASPELLVLGYLRNQRLVGGAAELESIAVDWSSGAAAVATRSGVPAIASARRPVTTGCGLGTAFVDLLDQIGAIHLPATSAARLSQQTLYRLLDIMFEQESLHRNAGSVHGCALFRGAELLVFVEDVSRHNGIDTLAGWMSLHGIDGGDMILYTTGRLSSEMVMKSGRMGVPILVSRNGVTAMGLEMAGKLAMTLIGRAAKRRFLCYVGADRFDADPQPRIEAVRAVDP